MLRKKANGQLQERTQSAVHWLNNDLEKRIISKIALHIKNLEAKPRTEKKIRALQTLLQAFKDKKEQLNQASVITKALNQSKNHETLLKEAEAIFKPGKNNRLDKVTRST